MQYFLALVVALTVAHVAFGQDRPPQAPPIPDAAARIAFLEARIAALEAMRTTAPCDQATGYQTMPGYYQQGYYQQSYYQQSYGGRGGKCGPVRRILGRCK